MSEKKESPTHGAQKPERSAFEASRRRDPAILSERSRKPDEGGCDHAVGDTPLYNAGWRQSFHWAASPPDSPRGAARSKPGEGVRPCGDIEAVRSESQGDEPTRSRPPSADFVTQGPRLRSASCGNTSTLSGGETEIDDGCSRAWRRASG